MLFFGNISCQCSYQINLTFSSRTQNDIILFIKCLFLGVCCTWPTHKEIDYSCFYINNNNNNNNDNNDINDFF